MSDAPDAATAPAPPAAPDTPDARMPSHARALTKSTLGSFVATGSEFLTLPLLVHVLHVAPYIGYVAVQFIATVITFLLNKYWAFEARDVGKLGGQTLRYAVVFAGSLSFNTGLSSLGHYVLHLQPVLAFAIAQVIVYIAWNYPMNRYFVFSRGRGGNKSASPPSGTGGEDERKRSL